MSLSSSTQSMRGCPESSICVAHRLPVCWSILHHRCVGLWAGNLNSRSPHGRTEHCNGHNHCASEFPQAGSLETATLFTDGNRSASAGGGRFSSDGIFEADEAYRGGRPANEYVCGSGRGARAAITLHFTITKATPGAPMVRLSRSVRGRPQAALVWLTAFALIALCGGIALAATSAASGPPDRGARPWWK